MDRLAQQADMMQHKRHAQVGATKNVFEDMIDRYAEAYIETFPEVKEFSNFEKSGTGNYYIGMVWMNDNERPDTDQIKLRGSSSLSNNRILELDLSAIDHQQSFFPGQILAFLGDPYLKKQLTVRKILDPMRVAPRMKSICTDGPIRLMIAAGPFMKPEQDDWDLYDKIIAQVKEGKVTHLILLGPFVDMENKSVRANYDVNWRTCFDKLVEGLYNHSCCVYLVPSSRDVLPDYLSATYFYPSPPLDFEVRLRDGIQSKCKIASVSDPAQIDLGGIYLDTTSAEVLFHLNRCSAFINKGGSIFSSMYRHLISQGIYPIYPAPNEIAVDYPKLIKHTQLDRLGAHILVLPSRFQTGVSNVENRLVVTVQKCSTKRQAIVVDIPKIESTTEAPTDTIVITDYTSKVVELSPRDEPVQGDSNGASKMLEMEGVEAEMKVQATPT